MTYLTPEELAADLAVPDLTDPVHGPHAVQLIVDVIRTALAGQELIIHRGERIVDLADNYDRLGYSPDAAARDSRYSRYVDERRLLRSQTSALVPAALRAIAARRLTEVVLICPGLVYRRDSIDRLHTGTPHQLDVWTLTRRRDELPDLISVVVAAALPGLRWRTNPATHPYTEDGLEIEAYAGGRWVEIGEGGRAGRHVLAGAGIAPDVCGLAIGLGLDRLVMLRKGIDDIRLLRSPDPRVAAQMTDLMPYRPVSPHPAARRDVSVAVPAGLTPEDVGGRVRDCLGADATLVEEVSILSTTAPERLPAAARERLTIRDGEVNLLVRVVLRDLRGTVTTAAANDIRDRIHAALHHMWFRRCRTAPHPPENVGRLIGHAAR
jgi:phenylalanyl-tRNA synthetase alpha chain